MSASTSSAPEKKIACDKFRPQPKGVGDNDEIPVIEFATPEEEKTIWGKKPREYSSFYFSETLPALFERTLTFDLLQIKDGAFSWIFTGPAASLTVLLEPEGVRLQQTFYDSYGLFFDPLVEDPSARTLGNCPRKIVGEKLFPLKGDGVKTLTVRFDDKLSVGLFVDGRPALEQKCVFDVTQHQVRFHRNCQARGKLSSPPAKGAAVTLSCDIRHQPILGFGGITSIPAYHFLSAEGKARWKQLLKDYNLLIHREYPPGLALQSDLSNWDRLEDAREHYYGDNFPNGEIVDFDYNRQIFEMGGTTWFEFWHLPEWVNPDQWEPNTLLEKTGLDVSQYCRAILDYCRRSLEESGAPPSIVGIQNEKCQPETVLNELVPALRQALDAAGFSAVKIHMANAGTLKEGRQYLARFQQHPDTWRHIDFVTTNIYDMQEHLLGDLDAYGAALEDCAQNSADKDKLVVECALQWGRFQINSYRVAFRMAELYHHLLTRFQAQSLVYCWLLLHSPQPSFDWTRSLFTVDLSHGSVPEPSSHVLRTLGAFSRKLLKGYHRVACLSDQRDLLTSAYIREGETPGCVIILINRGIVPIQATISLPEGMVGDFLAESCSLYSANAAVPGKITRSNEGRLGVSIAAGEIITVYSM